jgi:hypothetical protein
MMDAIRNGIKVSKTTSKIIKTGVMIEAFLYSLICAANVLIIAASVLFKFTSIIFVQIKLIVNINIKVHKKFTGSL